jgi:hypothetical protein
VIDVLITPAIRERLREIALQRNQSKQAEWTRRRSDIFSDAEVDLLGMIGEYAGCVALGTDLDISIDVHGDKGWDSHQGTRSIAFKFNHRTRGFLMVERRLSDRQRIHLEDFTADLIVLTYGNCAPPHCECFPPNPYYVHVAGYLPRTEFLAKYEARNWGLGVRYIVAVDELQPIEEIAPSRRRIRPFTGDEIASVLARQGKDSA